MKKRLKLFTALALGGFVFSGAYQQDFNIGLPAAASTQQIVAVVNEDAISQSDFEKRLNLIMASSGLQNTSEIRDRLAPQIISGLIDEQLMMQEAQSMNISIEQSEVESEFATIAQQNKMSPDEFEKMLRRGRIDVTTLHRQIRAQIAWSKVVQQRLRPRVVISGQDVDAAIQRMRGKVGTTEYLAAEIFLPYGDAKSEQEAQQLANKLAREIKSGKASFFKLAQQFSKGAGASRGGDTGWLNEGQIDAEILGKLQNIKKNQTTDPIKTEGGYHIMFLRDSRALSEDNLPSRQQVEYNLGNERLERLQRRHLLDIKASAYIDVRV